MTFTPAVVILQFAHLGITSPVAVRRVLISRLFSLEPPSNALFRALNSAEFSTCACHALGVFLPCSTIADGAASLQAWLYDRVELWSD